MKRLHSMIACAALLAACAAPEYADDESAETGKFDDLREDGSTFFVHANDRVCVTAPCPIYTAITPGAVRFDLSEVNLDLVDREIADMLDDGGVLVHGDLDVGSWEPGGDGTRLRVVEALAPAEEFLVWRKPEAGFTAITPEGDRLEADHVDLEGLAIGKREPTLDGLVAGDWVTKGFIGHSDTGVATLFATAVAGWSWPCTVFTSGIECVTAPCPIWSMVDPDGESLGNAASIDLRYLRLPPERELTLRTKIAAGSADVHGWVYRGSWQPHEQGDVLYVIDTDGDDW